MKIKLYFFGKKNEITAFEEEMSRRINFRCSFQLIPIDQAGIKESSKAKQIEADKACRRMSTEKFIIAFDEHGKEKNSADFSVWLKQKLVEYGSVAFIIGGAHGLDQNVLDKAHETLRCGKMVWTRNLFRQMACEQIYRALEIDGGSNFHKV